MIHRVSVFKRQKRQVPLLYIQTIATLISGALEKNGSGGFFVSFGSHFFYREGPPGWAEHPLRASGFEIKLNGE